MKNQSKSLSLVAPVSIGHLVADRRFWRLTVWVEYQQSVEKLPEFPYYIRLVVSLYLRSIFNLLFENNGSRVMQFPIEIWRKEGQITLNELSILMKDQLKKVLPIGVHSYISDLVKQIITQIENYINQKVK